MSDHRAAPYEFAFVVEHVLGHITHGDNLRAHVPHDPEVHPHWVPLPFTATGPASRLPGYRSNWTIRSGMTARRGLRQIRRTHTLDAVFFHTQVPAMLRPRWTTRIPSVISVDATPAQFDQLGSFYRHDVGPAAMERAKFRTARARFAEAAHIVTWSAWAKQGLVDQYSVPADKITVIPPGVHVGDWGATARATDRPSAVRLLFVGGDLERKGGHLLIEAFRTLREVDVELHIVTRDHVPTEQGIHVHHGLGPNSVELRELYRSCDVFVLPTSGDCLPMVLSEAGAAGLPIISTRVAAIPEIVLDGVTGLLVPAGDVAALAAALRRIVTSGDERRRMGTNAAAHIARHYDAVANTTRLLEVLKAAAGRAARSGVGSSVGR